MPQTEKKTKTKRAEKAPKLLNVAFIWDMSGSMGSIFEATKEGTQGYLLDLQKEERKLVRKFGEGIYTRVSLTAFDTIFEPWIVDQPIASFDVRKTVGKYMPRGGTALYDAIANTVTQLSEKDDGRAKFMVVVMTDGHENASKEYSRNTNGQQRLNQLISRLEEKGNWTFVYLGTDLEASVEAASIGIPAGNFAYYGATGQSVSAVQDAMSTNTSTVRLSKRMSSSTSFEDAGLVQDFRDEDDKS